jgi:hypothetical protein
MVWNEKEEGRKGEREEGRKGGREEGRKEAREGRRKRRKGEKEDAPRKGQGMMTNTPITIFIIYSL